MPFASFTSIECFILQDEYIQGVKGTIQTIEYQGQLQQREQHGEILLDQGVVVTCGIVRNRDQNLDCLKSSLDHACKAFLIV